MLESVYLEVHHLDQNHCAISLWVKYPKLNVWGVHHQKRGSEKFRPGDV